MKKLVISALVIGFFGAAALAHADCPANLNADQTVQCLRDRALNAEERSDFDFATIAQMNDVTPTDMPLERIYAWSDIDGGNC